MVNLLNMSEDISKLAKKKGVEVVEVISCQKEAVKISQRMHKLERIENCTSQETGIKVIKGKKSASVYFSGLHNQDYLNDIIDKAIRMCEIADDDKDLVYASGKDWSELQDLQLADSENLSIDEMKEYVKNVEDEAFAVDKISNSKGASISQSKANYSLFSSEGFAQEFNSTIFSSAMLAIASQHNKKELDYEYCITRYKKDLANPAKLGFEAAQKAKNRLNAQKIATGQMPVILDKRITSVFMDAFSSAINGDNLYKNASFLNGMLSNKIFNENITIIDDPLMKKGIGSQPFDGEGLAAKKLNLVNNGNLENYLLDLRSAKKLGMKSNANAARSIRNNIYPSHSNLYMMPGKLSKDDLFSKVKRGILITELSGQGVNIVNGDYSQGAFGFLIENGKITCPVHEITIAGNLKDIFMNMTPANDLEFKYEVNTPTILVNNMMIGGI